MGKNVLGNDPFLHGAAAREPAEGPNPAARAGESDAARAVAAAVEEFPLPPPKKLPREPRAGKAKAAGEAPGSAGAAARAAPGSAGDKAVSKPVEAVATPAAPNEHPAQDDGASPEPEGTAEAVPSASATAGEREAAAAPASGTKTKTPRKRPGKAGAGKNKARRSPLARSPFDAPLAEGPANRAVAVPEGLRPGDGSRPADDAGDFVGDGGLLPGDLAAAPPTPRVVAVAPVPDVRPPAPVRFVAPLGSRPATGVDALRGLVAILRRLSRLDSSLPSLEVDEFGRDPSFESRVRPLLSWMYRDYFRVDEFGFDKLPRSGPVILVANRAGPIPWDAAMVGVAAALHGREVRPLLEDAVFHFPFLGVLVNRLGAVRACPENAERLLSRGSAVAVFPEGAGGCAKPFRERYRVQRFGRGGFVRLALRTGATIVPVAVVGSEETYPILGRVPARPLGVPFLPITPTWPWLGPAGLWPLPTKWTIELGEPVDLAGLGPADANDDARVMRIAEGVRTTVQAMLDARLAERTGVFADGRAR